MRGMCNVNDAVYQNSSPKCFRGVSRQRLGIALILLVLSLLCPKSSSAQTVALVDYGLTFKTPEDFFPADEIAIREAGDCLPMLRGPKVKVIYSGKTSRLQLDTTIGIIAAPFPFPELPRNTIGLMKQALQRQGNTFTLLSAGEFMMDSRKAFMVVVSRPAIAPKKAPYCQFLAMTLIKGNTLYFVCTAKKGDFVAASKAYSSFLNNIRWMDKSQK